MSIQSATQAAAKQQTSLQAKPIAQQKNFMLKLLAVQMEKQSPLKPMDSSKIGQQLAAFASVEQQQMTNSLLKNLIDTVKATSSATPKSYVGRTASVKTNIATLNSDGFGKWTYTPPAETKKVALKITDEKGKLVFQKVINNPNNGENRVNWKGPVDAAGTPLKGKYKLTVEAYDAKNVATKVKNIQSIGKISKMIVDANGATKFVIHNQLFNKSDVKYVSK